MGNGDGEEFPSVAENKDKVGDRDEGNSKSVEQ